MDAMDRMDVMTRAATDARSGRDRRAFRAAPSSVRTIRAFVRDTLRHAQAPDTVVADLELVASELAANAIEHGTAPTWSVGVEAGPEWLTMDVTGGVAAPSNIVHHPQEWSIAPPDEASGRGLGIVRRLMEEVTVDTVDGEVRVTARARS